MSKGQQVQALCVAAVPEPVFERQVESLTPPTITELARQGKRARPGRPPSYSTPKPIVDLEGREPELTCALPFVGAVEDALRALEKLDIKAVPLLPTEERARALNLVGQIDVITDRIVVKMSQGRSMPAPARDDLGQKGGVRAPRRDVPSA